MQNQTANILKPVLSDNRGKISGLREPLLQNHPEQVPEKSAYQRMLERIEENKQKRVGETVDGIDADIEAAGWVKVESDPSILSDDGQVMTHIIYKPSERRRAIGLFLLSLFITSMAAVEKMCAACIDNPNSSYMEFYMIPFFCLILYMPAKFTSKMRLKQELISNKRSQNITLKTTMVNGHTNIDTREFSDLKDIMCHPNKVYCKKKETMVVVSYTVVLIFKNTPDLHLHILEREGNKHQTIQNQINQFVLDGNASYKTRYSPELMDELTNGHKRFIFIYLVTYVILQIAIDIICRMISPKIKQFQNMRQL